MFCNKYEFHNEDKRRWDALFRRIHASGDGNAVFKTLNGKYRDPRRKYYTAVYIRHCLHEFRQVRELLLKPDAVEVALWFHKIASDPSRKDNPSRSEELARGILYSVGGLSDHIAESALELIKVTGIDCRLSSHDTDAIMIADIVLSPLGADPGLFDRNMERIRRERGGAHKMFLQKQALLLQRLVKDRETIFRTDIFIEKYRKSAHKNIQRLSVHAGVV